MGPDYLDKHHSKKKNFIDFFIIFHFSSYCKETPPAEPLWIFIYSCKNSWISASVFQWLYFFFAHTSLIYSFIQRISASDPDTGLAGSVFGSFENWIRILIWPERICFIPQWILICSKLLKKLKLVSGLLETIYLSPELREKWPYL